MKSVKDALKIRALAVEERVATLGSCHCRYHPPVRLNDDSLKHYSSEKLYFKIFGA
ncbi:MAG: hypothetical protein WBQ25_13155 [Nitrososphaeraceae archaeon]